MGTDQFSELNNLKAMRSYEKAGFVNSEIQKTCDGEVQVPQTKVRSGNREY